MTYLDASALVALFLPDTHSRGVRSWLRQRPATVTLSSFGSAEFASAVSLRFRSGSLDADRATLALSLFDTWVATHAEVLDLDRDDPHLAGALIRRFDLGLRAPDALHIAICQRLALPLLTFDRRQADAAVALGVRLVGTES